MMILLHVVAVGVVVARLHLRLLHPGDGPPDLLHACVVVLLAPPRFIPCTMWWTRNSGAF